MSAIGLDSADKTIHPPPRLQSKRAVEGFSVDALELLLQMLGGLPQMRLPGKGSVPPARQRDVRGTQGRGLGQQVERQRSGPQTGLTPGAFGMLAES